jgi:hypothetical protein
MEVLIISVLVERHLFLFNFISKMFHHRNPFRLELINPTLIIIRHNSSWTIWFTFIFISQSKGILGRGGHVGGEAVKN